MIMAKSVDKIIRRSDLDAGFSPPSSLWLCMAAVDTSRAKISFGSITAPMLG